MQFEITISEPSEIQYLQILVLARYMALDLSNVHRNQFVVALEGKKIIGFIRLKQKEELFEVATMGVVKEYRNQGIGKMLLKYFMDRHDTLHLVTCIPNHFKKRGFISTENIPEALRPKVNNVALWAGYGDPVVMVYQSKKEMKN